MNVLPCGAVVWTWQGGDALPPSLPVTRTIWTSLMSSCGLEALHGMQEVFALQNTSLCFQ